MVPAQEIAYDEIDAHSRSRAHPAVEALAQKLLRADDPDSLLRGPVVFPPLGGLDAASIRFSFTDRIPHPSQHLAGNGHGGGLLAGRAAIFNHIRFRAGSTRIAVHAACCRTQRRSGGPALAMCPVRFLPPEAWTVGFSPA